MTQANTLLPTTPNRTDRDPSRSLVSLIEVPEVKASRVPRTPARGRTDMNGGRASRQPRPTYRRRRLRREIRIAGCVLLLLAPLASACTVGWSPGPVRVLACSINESAPLSAEQADSTKSARVAEQSESLAVDPAGAVVLSIDTAATPPGPDAEVPVIFPGYVLPDDSHEGSTHEGS